MYQKISKNPYIEIKHPWNLQAHLLSNWIYQLCVYPKVLDAVEKIIGPNILIQSADIFIKPPQCLKYINWHQDANYWGLEPFELVTGWIALTDVFLENGCMNYLPKSHLNNKIKHIAIITFSFSLLFITSNELFVDDYQATLKNKSQEIQSYSYHLNETQANIYDKFYRGKETKKQAVVSLREVSQQAIQQA